MTDGERLVLVAVPAVQRAWDLCFLSLGRPPRPLREGSLFAAAIASALRGALGAAEDSGGSRGA